MRLGFDAVQEHNHGLPWLAGKPRWWTVTRNGAPIEVVRVDYTSKDPDLLLWVILPVGAMVCPALVAPGLRFKEGFKHLENEMKGVWYPIDSDMGRALELRLVGMG